MAGAATEERRPGDTGTETPHSDPAPHKRWYVAPLGIFLVTRVIDAMLFVLAARDQQSPESLHTPPPGRPPLTTGSGYLHVIANWDGQWYRQIAEQGYPAHLPMLHGVVQENSWAFYPIYPWIVRIVMSVGLSFGAAASVVSIGFGAASACLLYRMIAPRAGRYTALLSVVALCTYPAAVLLQAAYTESLALFLTLVCVWCLGERRYGLMLAVALLLSLTRPICLPLALVAGLHGWGRMRHRHDDPFPPREAVKLAAVVMGVVASFAIWPAYVGWRTGRPRAYVETAGSWYHAVNHGSWLVALLQVRTVALVLVIVLAFAALGWVLLRPAARMWPTELRQWAFVYGLFLAVSTHATTSVFRHAMLMALPWWPLPDASGTVASHRSRVLLTVMVATLGFAMQYLWLRSLFVITPTAMSHP